MAETIAEVMRDAQGALDWCIRRIGREAEQGEPRAVLDRITALFPAALPATGAASTRPTITGEYVVSTDGGAVFLDIVPPPPFNRLDLRPLRHPLAEETRPARRDGRLPRMRNIRAGGRGVNLQAIWLDEGTEPDYNELHLFTHLYRSVRDPRTTAVALAQDHDHDLATGLYWASTWDAGASPEVWVSRFTAPMRVLGKLPCQADIEEHDPAKIRAFVLEFRKQWPWVPLSLTTEGFQGGWLWEIRDVLVNARVLMVPQAYDGAMNPFDAHGVVRDLVDVGFPWRLVAPFHDAQRLYRGWSGFAFSSGRLGP